jgi:tRNA modification GTPase
VVASKADLPAAWTPEAAFPDAGPVVIVSAERGDGLEELGGAIARRLVPRPPEPGAGVPFRAEQMDALQAARDAIARGDDREARAVLRSLRG